MTALELFIRDSKEIDSIHQSLAELRKVSSQWGGLTDKEESVRLSLIARRKELEAVMGFAAYDLRGDTSRVLRGWDVTLDPQWEAKAREIVARYEALARNHSVC